MRAQEFISESKTASAGEVWNYVKQLHPADQQGGGFLERLIRQYSKYQLQSVPVTDLIIYDQESDDPDEEPEQDPYGRVQVVDPEYAGEVSIHNIDRNPIVIDANGHILDGNHRAWAAAELLGRDTIRAWVPVEQIAENSSTQPIAGITVYHGNQGGIHQELITPMWWTQDKDTAVYYATQGGADGWVYQATLDCKNPYIITARDEPNDMLQKYNSLVQQGYDSIYDPRRGNWIPFYAQDIRLTGKEYCDGDEQELTEIERALAPILMQSTANP